MKIEDLGLIDYKTAWNIQRELVEKRKRGEIPDTLIVLRHHPVITLGRRAKRENVLVSEEVLKKKGVELYFIERGGDVTFHGPGQWVGYPILDLKERGRDISLYLRNLEEVLIRVLKGYGIEGRRIRGMTGVWVEERKIASIGVAVSRWITYHGFAFNVKPEDEYFSLINPCGLGREVTCLEKELGRRVEMGEVKEEIVKEFLKVFEGRGDFY